MTDIFLSYSRADRPKAEIMAKALEADGFSVWWDKVLRAGQTYDEVTETMLREAQVVIVLWSQTSVQSKWVRAEATLGQRNCELVPAMIEEAERPIMFELVQTADLIGWEGDRSETRWTEFVDDIKRSLHKAKTTENAAPVPPPASKPASPVPAPAPKPAPKPAAPKPAAPEPQRAEPPKTAPERKKSSNPLPLLLGFLIVAGGGGYFAYQTFLADPAANGSNSSVREAGAASPDCAVCPTMVRLEGGSVTLGSPSDEPDRSGNEGPQTEVQLPPFWISQTEVSWAQWQLCVDDGGCRAAQGRGEGSFPVTGVSWSDANAYADWLSAKSGFKYRVPSEAEWEYAARGGTQTAYWWGPDFPGPGATNGSAKDGMSFPKNPFGVSAMLGNVREWVADCYTNSLRDLPSDGSARLTGNCERRVVKGGSFSTGRGEHRAANRARYNPSIRDRSLGFRVVADQP
jgi:formylglycine-generating enzyme required for sulfatase activity